MLAIFSLLVVAGVVGFFFQPVSSVNAITPPPLPTIEGSVLTPEFGFHANPKKMVQNYLFREMGVARDIWRSQYKTLATIDDVKVYQQNHRDFFFDRLGQLWDKTPLRPIVGPTRTKGVVGSDAFRVETVLFESVPHFYVSAAMFLPDETRFKPPYPTLLIACGHEDEAKAYPSYQKAAALAATHGLAALIVDPLGEGERGQRLTSEGSTILHGTEAHYILGATSILLGRNTATFEVWDLTRALDYLESRPDVDAQRIGVAGNSGGGMQTAYLMALDDRVAAAAPICYLCGFYDHLIWKQGPQDSEQNIFGQLAFGMDHADYCLMRAPKPTMIGTTTYDIFPVEGAWETCRYAKRIFDRFGAEEKMSIAEHEDGHGWSKNLREATIRWMLRWLTDRNIEVVENESMPLCEPDELQCTPEGNVASLKDARSAFDLNRDYNDQLLVLRKEKQATRTDAELRATVRRVAGIRELSDIPRPSVEFKGRLVVPNEYHAIAEAKRLVLKSENGDITLPAIQFLPKETSKEIVLFLDDRGKTADMTTINRLVGRHETVLSVDLRGLGETKGTGARYLNHNLLGTDGIDFYFAYLLGKSFVGMRTEDLLSVARWSKEHYGKPVRLVASGESVELVALHAVSLEPTLFLDVKLEKSTRSWFDYVNEELPSYPITNVVHGALLEYDLPELERLTQ